MTSDLRLGAFLFLFLLWSRCIQMRVFPYIFCIGTGISWIGIGYGKCVHYFYLAFILTIASEFLGTLQCIFCTKNSSRSTWIWSAWLQSISSSIMFVELGILTCSWDWLEYHISFFWFEQRSRLGFHSRPGSSPDFVFWRLLGLQAVATEITVLLTTAAGMSCSR